MKPIILGTAGHIDHGKTSLIRALTGVDTDRLAEEKARGITIELGFASLALPSGQRLGIVDVPGHEKFVKNMVAGVTGIDVLAMVIAADEGVMPQTREHMEICSLLGVRHGMVVLTKIDMVDEEWLELVSEDVMEYMQGTFLEDAPMLRVSSTTGQGMEEFVRVLDKVCKDTPAHSSSGLFRLPVDRVFSMKGFGTVITGTLASGKVAVGDMIEIYPKGEKSKVRGVQVHNQSENEALAGMRTAINFQGLDRSRVDRGNVVAMPGTMKNSYMIDARLQYLSTATRPLKNNTVVRFHAGTSEIMAKVVLLEADELLPGEAGLIQIRLEEPQALVRDDRFVIRSYSPIRTIGGGVVIDPVPVKHKRLKAYVNDSLKRMLDAPDDELVELHARSRGVMGIRFSELLLATNLSAKKLQSVTQALLSNRKLVITDRDNRVFVHQRVLSGLEERAGKTLEQYHRDNELKAGMPKEELKSRLGRGVDARLFHLLMDKMSGSGEVEMDKDLVRLASHQVSLGQDQAELEKKILEAYQSTGLTPPYFKELQKSLDATVDAARGVLGLLNDQGVLIKVKEDLYFHAPAMEELKLRLRKFFAENEELTTPGFKEMINASRKYVIPLLEYLDSTRFTIRVGDVRKLRDAG